MRVILVIIGIVVVVFDVFLFLNPIKGGDINFIFNLVYSLIFVLGAFAAYTKREKFPDDPNMKKSLSFYALGLGFYALGLLVWTYYNLILRTPVPYPSLADLAFLMYYPGVIIGTYYLVHSFGGKFSAKLIAEGFLTFIVFFAILYIFLIQTSQGETVTFWARVLNITYPVADSFLTALGITILRTEKGISDHTNMLFFIFSFIVLAAADTIFSLRVASGAYWNGDISDLLFAISGFLTAWGILSL